MDFPTFSDCRELLANTRLTPALFGEGLGPFDLRELAIPVFPWDALWIFRVGQPVNVGERIRFAVASLRNCPASVGNGEKRSSVKITGRTYEKRA